MKRFLAILIFVTVLSWDVAPAEAGPLRRVGGFAVRSVARVRDGVARVGKAVIGKERRQARRSSRRSRCR